MLCWVACWEHPGTDSSARARLRTGVGASCCAAPLAWRADLGCRPCGPGCAPVAGGRGPEAEVLPLGPLPGGCELRPTELQARGGTAATGESLTARNVVKGDHTCCGLPHAMARGRGGLEAARSGPRGVRQRAGGTAAVQA